MTSGAAAVTGDRQQAVSPVQAQLAGLGRVIALETPGRFCGTVDLPARLDDRARDRLRNLLHGDPAQHGNPDQLGNPAQQGNPDHVEDQVAIRSAGMYVRRLARAGMAGRREGRDQARWQPRGTVLITGGTGALGAQTARWLAGQGAGHLVLASRSGAAAPGSAALVADLEAAGARVTVAACDVADRAQVADFLSRLSAQGTPVRSVFHTAGLTSSVPTGETSLGDFAEVCAAKTAGAEHLDELLAGEPLDAFVLFSSISGIWGSGAQAAYSCANARLDALAERRRERGLPATALAWGPWAGDGMAAVAEHAANLRRRGLHPLDPQAALAAMQAALDDDETCLTIADVDWDTFVPLFTVGRPAPFLDGVPEAAAAMAIASPAGEANPGAGPGSGELRRQLAEAAEADRGPLLMSLIQARAAAALGHASPETVETGRSFSALGFDSLTAVEFRTALGQASGLTLPATLVFDYPTPAALLEYLRAQLVPDELPAGDAFLAQLERLDAAAAASAADGLVRAKITMRLQNLLATLTAGQAGPVPAPNGNGKAGSAVDAIASADDDELFALINRDLGRS